MQDDPKEFVPRAEFYRALGLLYFLVGALAFAGVSAAVNTSNPLVLVPWVISNLAVFALSIGYFVRARRAQKRDG